MRPTRALLVIELRITDPAQIPEALTAVNPPRIPHFAGNVRVTMDAFGEDAADNPATRDCQLPRRRRGGDGMSLRRRKPKARTRPGPASDEPWEWMQIRAQAGQDERGWVPRWFAESVGVDCSPLDSRDDQGRQGTVWIRNDQSEALRESSWWRTPEAFGGEAATDD